MRLEIGANIDNKRVRLDFKKDNSRAGYMPSYQINKIKADEFVAKYNKQSSFLKKVTIAFVCSFAVLGGYFGIKSNRKFMKPLSIILGVLSGLGIGAMISKKERNSLMDKYEVKDISDS